MSPHFERALRFAEMQQNGAGPNKMHDWTLSELHCLAFEFQQTHDLAVIQAAAATMRVYAERWSPPHGEWCLEGLFNELERVIKDLRVDK